MRLAVTGTVAPMRHHPPRLVALSLTAAALLAACSSAGNDASPSSTTAAPTATTTAPPKVTASERKLLADRPVTFSAPDGPKPTRADPAPLVILLHGYGVTGEVQDAYLKLTPAANAAGMITVHPDGTPNALGKRYWNATDACCAGPASKVDDSAYIDAIIHEAKARYAIDPKRVYLVGHSNGGFMSHRMACDHADEVAAIVSIAGATWDDASRCRPSEPVSVVEVHGRSDTTILFDGNRIAGRTYPGAEQTVATWAELDGCDPTPVADPEPAGRKIVDDLPPATVTAYGGCEDGTAVELWDQPRGVHIPSFTDDFSEQVVAWLQAHPKG